MQVGHADGTKEHADDGDMFERRHERGDAIGVGDERLRARRLDFSDMRGVSGGPANSVPPGTQLPREGPPTAPAADDQEARQGLRLVAPTRAG